MLNISPAATSRGNGAHPPAAPGLLALGANDVAQSGPVLRTYIVEDSQVIRENLIATLEELAPIEVIGTAEDESSAVQWLMRPSSQFDLVIIDIFLKRGSGLGVLRSLSGLGKPHRLVVLSNYATQDMRHKCKSMGADRVFDKSNEIDALLLYCKELAAESSPGGAGQSPAS